MVCVCGCVCVCGWVGVCVCACVCVCLCLCKFPYDMLAKRCIVLDAWMGLALLFLQTPTPAGTSHTLNRNGAAIPIMPPTAHLSPPKAARPPSEHQW